MKDDDDLPLFRHHPPLHRSNEPPLSGGDLKRLRGKKRDVLELLIDAHTHKVGGWVGLNQLREVGGSSGDRRARELRAHGLSIEVQRDPAARESGVWRYRLHPGGLRFALDVLSRLNALNRREGGDHAAAWTSSSTT